MAGDGVFIRIERRPDTAATWAARSVNRCNPLQAWSAISAQLRHGSPKSGKFRPAFHDPGIAGGRAAAGRARPGGPPPRGAAAPTGTAARAVTWPQPGASPGRNQRIVAVQGD